MKTSINSKTLSALVLMAISVVTLVACSQGEVRKPAISEGSWWTDGRHYYEVKASDANSIKMEGYTLHEGGFMLELNIKGSQMIVADSEDPHFGKPGDTVKLQTVINSENDSLELLIAYRDQQPVAALQLYDGDELTFENNAIRTVLAGKYADADNPKNVWTFNPDGTISMDSNKDPQPYAIALVYHIPTNILALPGDLHLSVMLNEPFEGEIERMHFFKATYNEDEDEWTEDEEVYSTMVRQDKIEWYTKILFTNCIASYFSISDVENLIPEIRKSDSELAKLNASLMEAWLNSGDE